MTDLAPVGRPPLFAASSPLQGRALAPATDTGARPLTMDEQQQTSPAQVEDRISLTPPGVEPAQGGQAAPAARTPAPATTVSLNGPLQPEPPGLGVSMGTSHSTGRPGTTTPVLMLEEFHPGLSESERSLVAQLREVFSHAPQMAMVLEVFIADKDHPMGIVAHLKNPETRAVVIGHLKEMTSGPAVSHDEFHFTVQTSDLASNDAEYSIKDGQKKDRLLRSQLLAEDPVLYSTGDAPTTEQMDSLKVHARKLRNEVLEHLRADLGEVISGLPNQDGFPVVAARAKSAEGIIDKIHRMRVGNDGKAPRPEYCLADVPDAVGGRITLSNPEHLDAVKKAIEEKYGKENISQKDDFYTNPDKKLRPYRCVTYTVNVDGVPCEIQVTTLRSSLTADLVHNTAYKPLHPELPSSTISYLLDLQRAVTAQEHAQLCTAQFGTSTTGSGGATWGALPTGTVTSTAWNISGMTGTVPRQASGDAASTAGFGSQGLPGSKDGAG